MDNQQQQTNNNQQPQPISGMKRKLKEYGRVLKITKKPNSKEFWSVVKITGAGILIIGLVGFVILSIKIVVKGIF